ncbi:hypothetical protein QFZ80_005167 [Paenibacillus sp. V4I7]|nr:hypothetical protein [Paenibacillus sp. V4I7]MDQ0920162.1 hypothetical protein [Paenibacillus sp. V4I5]
MAVYLFLLDGNDYNPVTNPSPTGNTYSIINLNTGLQVERTWTRAKTPTYFLRMLS